MITPAGSKLLTYNLCMHLLLMNHNGRKIPRMMITHAGHGNWKKKKKKKTGERESEIQNHLQPMQQKLSSQEIPRLCCSCTCP